MKEIIVRTVPSYRLNSAILAHARYLGHTARFEDIEVISRQAYMFYFRDSGCTYVPWDSSAKPTHALEEFFSLKPEDVQDYKPKKHRVNAAKIKEALGVDSRDEIELTD